MTLIRAGRRRTFAGPRAVCLPGDHDLAEVIPHRDLADDDLADADETEPLGTVAPAQLLLVRKRSP